MKSFIFFILVVVASVNASAQREATNWYFGNNSGITFKNGAPVYLPGSVMISAECSAVISDRTTGALLFYTDGATIWNSSHQIMQYGTGLLGGQSAAQGAVIVPDPADNNQYYVFTGPNLTLGAPPTSGFHYSIVSMATPGGKVITKNVPLIDDVGEPVTATRDCEGTGYWVVTESKKSHTPQTFYSFHVTADGVTINPVVSSMGDTLELNSAWGHMKFSPNGAYLAAIDTTAHLCLFDFNTQTGVINNKRELSTDTIYFGHYAFSPDNSKLYAPGYSNSGFRGMYQFEVNAGDAAAITASGVVVGEFPETTFLGDVQLGPDGKLYFANAFNPWLDAIQFPNLKGTACGCKQNAVPLGNNCRFGLPQFMDYYLNDPKPGNPIIRQICKGSSVQIGVSPNPDRSYSWSPTTGLSKPNIANPFASPTSTTTYTLKVSNATSGCFTIMQEYTVNVIPLPKADAGEDKVVCGGVPTQLGRLPDSGCTYTWSPSTELNNPNIANPIATPTQTRKYTLTVTNANNCTAIDSVTVTVTAGAIIAKVSPDTAICAGTTLLLAASGGSEYLWSPTEGLDNPTSPTPTATPTTTTRYTVRVSSGTCVDSASVLVTVVPLPTADAGKDVEICAGEIVPIGAPAVKGYIYSWTPTDGLDNPQSAMPNCSVTTPTQYILSVRNTTGCLATDTVMVGISTLQVVISPDTTICPGASVRLSASGGTIYKWTPATGLDDPTLPNPLASPATTTTYTVDVQNAHGCTASARVTVAVSSAFLSVTASDTVVCRGKGVQLTANGGSGYSWFPTAGLNNTNIPNPYATPDTTTLYGVTAINGNCRDTAYVRVNVLPLPTVQAGNDTTICIGESVSIGNPPITGHTYSWSPMVGIDDPTSANPTTQPTQTTNYILTEANENGCVNYDTVTVGVRQRYELAFTLAPPVISLLPGQPFTASLHIPQGVQSWTAQLRYDAQIAGFDSIIQTSAQITASASEDKGVLTLNGSGENGDIMLGFHAYLPVRLDTTLLLSLGVTSLKSNPCDYATTQASTLQFGEFCAKNLRFVNGTGKKYFLRAQEHSLEFGVGLSGRIRLELYDNVGQLRQVIADSFINAGEYAVDVDLPSGVYFYRMSAGAYQQVEPLVIVR